jgi:hypothetical protein
VNVVANFSGSRLDLFIHVDAEAGPKTIDLLNQILTGVQNLANELAQLQADVAAEDTVVDSAVTLLTGIKAALDAAIASGNPAALTALSADIQAKTAVLSQAVATNTPAAPTP